MKCTKQRMLEGQTKKKSCSPDFTTPIYFDFDIHILTEPRFNTIGDLHSSVCERYRLLFSMTRQSCTDLAESTWLILLKTRLKKKYVHKICDACASQSCTLHGMCDPSVRQTIWHRQVHTG